MSMLEQHYYVQFQFFYLSTKAITFLFRDSFPTFCGEYSSCASQQQLGKKRRTLGPGELQMLATEVR